MTPVATANAIVQADPMDMYVSAPGMAAGMIRAMAGGWNDKDQAGNPKCQPEVFGWWDNASKVPGWEGKGWGSLKRTDSIDLGTAGHGLLFDSEFRIVGVPDSVRRNSPAWRQCEAANPGKFMMKQSLAANAIGVWMRVRPAIESWTADAEAVHYETSIYWPEELPCGDWYAMKTRPDCLIIAGRQAWNIDLKVTTKWRRFRWHAQNMNYPIQLAQQKAGILAGFPQVETVHCFNFAVEPEPPFRMTMHQLKGERLREAEYRRGYFLDEIHKRRRSGDWRGEDGGIEEL